MVIQTILQALSFIFPAYVANASPVVLGGGTPMDGGKNFVDGKRILGDGKTIRGTVLGFLVGSFAGFIQIFVWEQPMIQSLSQKTIGWAHSPWGWEVPVFLSLGALLGDIFASFLKRRIGYKRGMPTPGLDQLDFLVGAILLASIFWFPPFRIIITLLVLTPLLHLGLNMVAYRLGFKSEPY